MTPCINTHCSLSKHSCQRYSCTLELRNRLERRRSERDHFKARLETDAADSMRSLRKLKRSVASSTKTASNRSSNCMKIRRRRQSAVRSASAPSVLSSTRTAKSPLCGRSTRLCKRCSRSSRMCRGSVRAGPWGHLRKFL